MVVFELAVLLAFVSIAAFPCWRYSADWGYLPSAVSGVLLLVMTLVAVTDKGPDRLGGMAWRRRPSGSPRRRQPTPTAGATSSPPPWCSRSASRF